MEHLTTAALEEGIDQVRGAPGDQGRLELIVRRPQVEAREVLSEATLDEAEGLVGDTWREREAGKNPGGVISLDEQITIMNARAAELVAGHPDRWPLAGDQLFVDFDISEANLPIGSRVALGSAVIEISFKPHTGCQKFSARFGADALRFVNSPVGRELRLRGANAWVVVPGTVRVGDVVRKLPPVAGSATTQG
jgi:MOSC domain-containing protein YiiM